MSSGAGRLGGVRYIRDSRARTDCIFVSNHFPAVSALNVERAVFLSRVYSRGTNLIGDILSVDMISASTLSVAGSVCLHIKPRLACQPRLIPVGEQRIELSRSDLCNRRIGRSLLT